jgi:hypothetical protein
MGAAVVGHVDGVSSWTVSIRATPTGTSLIENGPSAVLPALPMKTWTTLGIDLRLGQGTRVTYNGAVQNEPAGSPAASAKAAPFVGANITIGGGSRERRSGRLARGLRRHRLQRRPVASSSGTTLTVGGFQDAA